MDGMERMFACFAALQQTHAWNLDAIYAGMVWNFALHVYELNTKHTIEDMDVLTYLVFPMIWWWPIFSLSLSFYATHCLGLSPVMSHQCAIYVVFTVSGDGLSHPSQNFTSFCVVRHKGWFENKVFSKYD
jgi:hypothetical protein